MKRLFQIIPILLLFCGLAACEESTAPIDLPYVERLVVQGELTAGEGVRLRISRTMPLNSRQQQSNAWITDVKGYIENRGIRYELRYDTQSIYRANMTPVVGETFTLVAEWRGKRVTATTRIPEAAGIDRVRYERREGRIEVDIDPRDPEAVYGVEIYGDDRLGGAYQMIGLSYGRPIYRMKDTNERGIIEYVFDGYYSYEDPTTPRPIRAMVYAYDRPFYDFFNSYYRSDDFSFNNEASIHWNVEGDGIGLFIGRTRTERLE